MKDEDEFPKFVALLLAAVFVGIFAVGMICETIQVVYKSKSPIVEKEK